MNKSIKTTCKKTLVILLAVITMVGFGMPGLSYFDASGSLGIYSYAAVKTGGEYIKSIKGTTITTKDGQKEKYNTGMTFVSGGSEITYASAKTKVKAGKSVKVYKQYFKPYKNIVSGSDDGDTGGAPGGGTDTGNKFGSSTSKIGTAKFRIGYYITNGGIDGDLSLVKAKSKSGISSLVGKTLSLGKGVVGGTVKTSKSGRTTTVNNLKVNSYSDNLNPIVVQGTNSSKKTYAKINNAKINLLGKSDGNGTVCDFSAWGAAISTFDNASTIIDKANIHTTGVARCAVEGDDGSDTLIKNSKIKVDGGTLYDGYINSADTETMVAPPWVLGIVGNARATNLLGDNSTMTVYNSDVYAAKWGVLSTDGCSNVVLNAINTKINMDLSGDDLTEDSGYGAYAIGSATENFYGSTFNVPTYAVICANGDNVVNFLSSKGNIQTMKYSDAKKTYVKGQYSFKDSQVKDQKTTVNSENFGVSVWGGGTVNVKDGTTFNTGSTAFLFKTGGQHTGAAVNIDNAKINTENNTLLQVLDNEDSAATDPNNEGMVFVNKYYEEKEGWLGLENDTLYKAGEKDKATTEAINVTNATLSGDIYNGSGYKQMAAELNVTLGKGANLTGAISASTIKHTTDGGKTQNTNIPMSKYYQFGHVINKAYYNGANDVNLTLTDDAVWNVDDESIVTSLTVGAGAKINGTVYVNGTKTTVEAGKTYTGTITVKPL